MSLRAGVLAATLIASFASAEDWQYEKGDILSRTVTHDFRGQRGLVAGTDARLDVPGAEATIEFFVKGTWADNDGLYCVLLNGATDETTRILADANTPDGDTVPAFQARYGIWIDKDALYVQSGHLLVEFPWEDQIVVGAMAPLMHVAVTIAGEGATGTTTVYVDGNQAITKPFGFGEGCGVGELHVGGLPEACRGGVLKDTSRRKPLMLEEVARPYVGQIGGLRLWSRELDSDLLKRRNNPPAPPAVSRWNDFMLDRWLRLKAEVGAELPSYFDLVARSDFTGASSEHRIKVLDPLDGNWILPNQKHAVPMPTGQFGTGEKLTHTFGNMVDFPLVTLVRDGEGGRAFYVDSLMRGTLSGSGQGWRLELIDGSLVDVLVDRESERLVLREVGEDSELLENLLKSRVDDAFVLVRADRELLPPVSGTDPFTISSRLKKFRFLQQSYDFFRMDPFYFTEKRTQAPIFAAPEATDWVAENEENLLTPSFFRIKAFNESMTSAETITTTNKAQFDNALGLRLGAHAKGTFDSGSGKIEFGGKASENFTQTGTSLTEISWGFARTLLVWRDKVLNRFDPDFVDAVERVGHGSLSPQGFTDLYGTHYAYAVSYGAMAHYIREFTEQEFEQAWRLGADVSAELEAGGDVWGEVGVKGSLELERGESKSELFSRDKRDIVAIGGIPLSYDSLIMPIDKENQVPIFLDLRPIYELLSPAWFDDPAIYGTAQERLRDFLVERSSQYDPAPDTFSSKYEEEQEITVFEFNLEDFIMGGVRENFLAEDGGSEIVGRVEVQPVLWDPHAQDPQSAKGRTLPDGSKRDFVNQNFLRYAEDRAYDRGDPERKGIRPYGPAVTLWKQIARDSKPWRLFNRAWWVNFDRAPEITPQSLALMERFPELVGPGELRYEVLADDAPFFALRVTTEFREINIISPNLERVGQNFVDELPPQVRGARKDLEQGLFTPEEQLPGGTWYLHLGQPRDVDLQPPGEWSRDNVVDDRRSGSWGGQLVDEQEIQRDPWSHRDFEDDADWRVLWERDKRLQYAEPPSDVQEVLDLMDATMPPHLMMQLPQEELRAYVELRQEIEERLLDGFDESWTALRERYEDFVEEDWPLEQIALELREMPDEQLAWEWMNGDGKELSSQSTLYLPSMTDRNEDLRVPFEDVPGLLFGPRREEVRAALLTYFEKSFLWDAFPKYHSYLTTSINITPPESYAALSAYYDAREVPFAGIRFTTSRGLDTSLPFSNQYADVLDEIDRYIEATQTEPIATLDPVAAWFPFSRHWLGCTNVEPERIDYRPRGWFGPIGSGAAYVRSSGKDDAARLRMQADVGDGAFTVDLFFTSLLPPDGHDQLPGAVLAREDGELTVYFDQGVDGVELVVRGQLGTLRIPCEGTRPPNRRMDWYRLQLAIDPQVGTAFASLIGSRNNAAEFLVPGSTFELPAGFTVGQASGWTLAPASGDVPPLPGLVDRVVFFGRALSGEELSERKRERPDRLEAWERGSSSENDVDLVEAKARARILAIDELDAVGFQRNGQGQLVLEPTFAAYLAHESGTSLAPFPNATWVEAAACDMAVFDLDVDGIDAEEFGAMFPPGCPAQALFPLFAASTLDQGVTERERISADELVAFEAIYASWLESWRATSDALDVAQLEASFGRWDFRGIPTRHISSPAATVPTGFQRNIDKTLERILRETGAPLSAAHRAFVKSRPAEVAIADPAAAVGEAEGLAAELARRIAEREAAARAAVLTEVEALAVLQDARQRFQAGLDEDDAIAARFAELDANQDGRVVWTELRGPLQSALEAALPKPAGGGASGDPRSAARLAEMMEVLEQLEGAERERMEAIIAQESGGLGRHQKLSEDDAALLAGLADRDELDDELVASLRLHHRWPQSGNGGWANRGLGKGLARTDELVLLGLHEQERRGAGGDAAVAPGVTADAVRLSLAVLLACEAQGLTAPGKWGDNTSDDLKLGNDAVRHAAFVGVGEASPTAVLSTPSVWAQRLSARAGDTLASEWVDYAKQTHAYMVKVKQTQWHRDQRKAAEQAAEQGQRELWLTDPLNARSAALREQLDWLTKLRAFRSLQPGRTIEEERIPEEEWKLFTRPSERMEWPEFQASPAGAVLAVMKQKTGLADAEAQAGRERAQASRGSGLTGGRGRGSEEQDERLAQRKAAFEERQAQKEAELRDESAAEGNVALSVGAWRDSNGDDLTIAVEGARVTVTPSAKLSRWWDRGLGVLDGHTLTMEHFKGQRVTAKVEGTVTEDGKRIDWKNNTHWVRVD